MASTTSGFPQFCRFPAEIRLCIWELSLPEDIPEVYILGSELGAVVIEPSVPVEPVVRKVLTGIPPLLHACHEARHTALSKLSFLSIKAADKKPLRVPCRRFRPDYDSLFIPQSSFIMFMIDVMDTAETEGACPFYSEIRHLALHSSEMFGGFDDLRMMLHRFTSLREISFVFGPSYGDMDTPGDIGHGRRLKHFYLTDWTDEFGRQINSQLETTIPIDAVLDHLEGNLSDIEVADGSPWDEDTGQWLFKLDAKKLIARPCYGLG